MSKDKLTPAVILVADRTLSANYKILFEGIFGTLQTTQVPEIVMRHFVAPPVAADSMGRATKVPLGLRRVEACLLAQTSLGPEDVVCTTPEALDRLLGPWVKAVAFSSSDPLGTGMSNTTTANFLKGQLYTKYWTARMMRQLSEAKDKYGFKILVGGAGAWQWMYDPKATRKAGVDTVFEGYFEAAGPALVTDIIAGRSTADHICEPSTAVEHVAPIRGASMLGILELSRGCGRGCRFCTMARKKMSHLPAETILADLQTNVASGVSTVVSGSEDFFRYGSDSIKPAFDKLYDLLVQMQRIKGLSFMQIDHANISSVLQLTDEQLSEIRRLLTWRAHSDYLWVNMGAESANGKLVAANSAGKIAPFSPENWRDRVLEAADRMQRNGYFSVFSIILGLPGETGKDVVDTLAMVRKLAEKNAIIFPVFYEPPSPESAKTQPAFTVDDMRADHLELFSTCYEINFRKVPKLYWDNQRAGGVSLTKRALVQMLGKTEVVSWRRTFKKLRKKIDERDADIEEDKQYGKRCCSYN